MLWFRALLAAAILPGTVAGLVPWLLWRSGLTEGWMDLRTTRWLGLVPLALGVALLIITIRGFAKAGKGTLAPWDAPQQLVVSGIYRYSRNPMYVGVVAILLGEAMWASSAALLIYSVAVCTAFQMRVVFYEEPVLRQQFGDVFDDYCARVPRWLGPLRR